MRKKIACMICIAPFAIAALAALGGYIVECLWNWLVPGLFGWHAIGFWQALGLLVLSRLLFGGLCHGHGPSGRFRERMDMRWRTMTTEERERFRQGWRSRFCCSGEPGSKPTE